MRQGEVWLINLDPTVGAEIKKRRPCVVVNRDAVGKLPLRIICPITHWSEKKAHASWMVPISANSENGLSKFSIIDCFQPRALSVDRFVKKLGRVSDSCGEKIKKALALVLDFEN